MTAFTIEQIVRKHRELTHEKAAMLQRHVDELKPLNDKIDAIEVYILARMNQDGTQNYKTEAGTAYQSKLTSVKLEDPVSFRNFILEQVIERILDVVVAMGAQGVVKDRDKTALLSLVGTEGKWDLADIKPSKKGIVKWQEETQQSVPGISMSQIVNVNVRAS